MIQLQLNINTIAYYLRYILNILFPLPLIVGARINDSFACNCPIFSSAMLCPKHFNYALIKGQGYPLIMCYGLKPHVTSHSLRPYMLYSQYLWSMISMISNHEKCHRNTNSILNMSHLNDIVNLPLTIVTCMLKVYYKIHPYN